MIRCGACGSKLRGDDAFCMECGTNVSSGASVIPVNVKLSESRTPITELVQLIEREEEMIYEPRNGKKLQILMVGPGVNSSPLPLREMKEFLQRYGKEIRYNRSKAEFEKCVVHYVPYEHALGLRGYHPDLIFIVNIYLFDVHKWWRVLTESIIPMARLGAVVKYWRW